MLLSPTFTLSSKKLVPATMASTSTVSSTACGQQERGWGGGFSKAVRVLPDGACHGSSSGPGQQHTQAQLPTLLGEGQVMRPASSNAPCSLGEAGSGTRVPPASGSAGSAHVQPCCCVPAATLWAAGRTAPRPTWMRLLDCALARLCFLSSASLVISSSEKDDLCGLIGCS
jgi:hypothetical protein